MMGGLNTVGDVLKQYDPLIGGYYRIFMVRKPSMMVKYFQTNTGTSKFDQFKHILEYGNLGFSGVQSPTVEFASIQGGYNNKTLEIPSMSSDGTNELSIKVFELSGSPIREVLYTWVNMVVDLDSGFAHYGGMIASGTMGYSQAAQTCEFIIAVTDRTGMKLEYAVHLTNCFPKTVPTDHFNGEAGQHDIASYDITFTANARYGLDVNRKALLLLKNHQIMVNSLDSCTGLDESDAIFTSHTAYASKTGTIETMSSDYSTIGKKHAPKFNINDTKHSADPNADAIMNDTSDTAIRLRPTPSFTEYGNRYSDGAVN